MTGFAGVVGPFGWAADPGLAGCIAEAIAPMGPDRRDTWHEGRVFLAHALLATTFEEEGDVQPLTFDGAVRLVADARIDGRDDLIRELRAAGRTPSDDAPDSALILHAYHAWGEACVERLIGDFAFAVWDARRNTLFCARDQFGSVPFYYARIGEVFAFANAVPALLAHAGLDRSLNRVAIGDYLMFGYSLDPVGGFYRHIDRLPPAHAMTMTDGRAKVWRYWALPAADFAAAEREKPEDLIARFGEILSTAVGDRLRWGRVATTLSGGMDSTLVSGLAQRQAGAARIDAFCLGSDWLAPDNEREWASRCADHLGIPFHPMPIEPAFTDPPGGPWRLPPEPRLELRASSFHLLGERLAGEGVRVLLMGMGGDVITNGGLTHWTSLIRDRRFGRLMKEALVYWRHHRRRPPLRTAWRRSRPAPTPPIGRPLDPDFFRDCGLEERWLEREKAFRLDPRIVMQDPFWSEMFVASHPESTRLPLRVRQPFFDVRLVEAAMRLPPTPWQFDKALLRRFGRDLLPSEILARPKTPFGVNPGWLAACRGLEPWIHELPNAVELEGYVDKAKLGEIIGALDALPPAQYSGAVIIPGGLAMWLRNGAAGGIFK